MKIDEKEAEVGLLDKLSFFNKNVRQTIKSILITTNDLFNALEEKQEKFCNKLPKCVKTKINLQKASPTCRILFHFVASEESHF